MTENNIHPEYTAGAHDTYWLKNEKPISFNQLEKNLETDVVIVGGGIAGLSVAYCLSKAGKKIVLVEDGYIGSGETGRTSAHLVNALDDRYYHLKYLYGREGVQLAAQSHAEAINFIERTIEEEKIDCDFKRVNGYLFLHPSDKENSLDKELKAGRLAGIGLEKLKTTPGLSEEKIPCLVFPKQAKFHPMKYMRGLSDAVIKLGGKIYTQTHAAEIKNTGITSKQGYTVKAKHVVIATNSPINNKYFPHMQQYANRTYIIGALVKKDVLPDALWWDTGDYEMSSSIPPYHYVRLDHYNNEYDLLMCGGEDHPTGLAEVQHIPEEQRYKRLETWAKKYFPVEQTIIKWSGQVFEPMDSLAYIGRNVMDRGNVYIATGDSGNGLTHGTIAGILITDLITGRPNPWDKLYNPSRFKYLKAGTTFIKEFVGGFYEYLKQSSHHVDQLSSIGKGQAGIIEMNKEKYGVYHDLDDELHVVNAKCTHMGCLVHWNNDEKSWDCPCHGSRFTIKGEVITGPANTDLNYTNSNLNTLELLKNEKE